VLLLLSLALAGQAFAECKQGDKADVLWQGSWYPATVLHGNGDRCFIHYDGYESSWDEWVGPDRIKLKGAKRATTKAPPPPPGRYQEGDPVQVLWKGAWYDAHILKSKGAQSFIHYDGYDNSWDEWVGPERIRPKAGATPPPPPPDGPKGPPPGSQPPPPPPGAHGPGGFDAARYLCSQFLADSQAKNPKAAQALDYAIDYFGKRSGKSMAGMDANARMGFEMAFGMECPESPQASWESIVQKVYESTGKK
jgi:hypothetical protein